MSMTCDCDLRLATREHEKALPLPVSTDVMENSSSFETTRSFVRVNESSEPRQGLVRTTYVNLPSGIMLEHTGRECSI
jgi:hypothetical protein